MIRVDWVAAGLAILFFYVGRALFGSPLIFWSLVGVVLLAMAAFFAAECISYDPPAGV